jgi:hypothetical protein
LEDLGNIGEFVGAIGVVLSLVYLAIQIRQRLGGLQHRYRWLQATRLAGAFSPGHICERQTGFEEDRWNNGVTEAR